MVGRRLVWSMDDNISISKEKMKGTTQMVLFFKAFKGVHHPKSQVNRGAPLGSGRVLWEVVQERA